MVENFLQSFHLQLKHLDSIGIGESIHGRDTSWIDGQVGNNILSLIEFPVFADIEGLFGVLSLKMDILEGGRVVISWEGDVAILRNQRFFFSWHL